MNIMENNSSILNSTQRLILGIIVLILVDVIWVLSSELTEYIFNHEKFDKPFFSTYVKTSMFLIFFFGFLCYQPWQETCRSNNNNQSYSRLPTAEPDPETTLVDEVIDDNANPAEQISPSQFVPINYDCNSGNESGDEGLLNGGNKVHRRSVRFSKLAEVRQLSDGEAVDALFSRLSYQASIQAEQEAYRLANRLSPAKTAKLAMTFCLMWFLANYTYQLALSNTEVGIVNVLSSSSGLFTLILASIFPSVLTDRFTLSKLLAVLVSVGGVAIVSLSDFSMQTKKLPLGTVFAIFSAFFYASYLVFLRKKVDHEDKLDIPMFFGFVGLFNLIILWPFFFVLHYTEYEEFCWPTKRQWLFLCFNGVIGTVFSEVLWLWGCFLTSSLIATLAISLTIPMSMIADILFNNITYSPLFYIGTIPMLLSFFAVNFLAHFENWDPALDLLRRILIKCQSCFPVSRNYQRVLINSDPENESLVNVDENVDEDNSHNFFPDENQVAET